MNIRQKYNPYEGALRGFFVFFLLLVSSLSLSQKVSNAGIRELLVKEYLQKKNICLKEVSGTFKNEIYTPSCSDSVSRLSLQTPEIQYQQYQKQQYIRILIQPVELYTKDTLVSELLMFQDTLNRKELIAARKGSPYSLKGDNPLPTAKYLRPALWTAGSLIAVLTLFYFRG
ncbi:MAG: hypothetical protein K1X92_15810 [Bacteroidia bacterium]|nr:hypothetical protein [Bacteroidia bacterium]